MRAHPTRAIFAATLLLCTAASAQELIENVVVRNRMHQLKGRFELGVQGGIPVLTRLTEHYNFTLNAAWNMNDVFALELQGGYAFSKHTSLSDQIAAATIDSTVKSTDSDKSVDDLAGLWEMQGNGVIGLRWAPLYGKINLMSDLPVHFQMYLWLGGGAGSFTRESVVDCDEGGAGCAIDTKVGPIVSAAFGFRFFATEHVGLRLEIRDFIFPDSYREDVLVKRPVGTTGTAAASPGIINLALINIGVQFVF